MWIYPMYRNCYCFLHTFFGYWRSLYVIWMCQKECIRMAILGWHLIYTHKNTFISIFRIHIESKFSNCINTMTSENCMRGNDICKVCIMRRGAKGGPGGSCVESHLYKTPPQFMAWQVRNICIAFHGVRSRKIYFIFHAFECWRNKRTPVASFGINWKWIFLQCAF